MKRDYMTRTDEKYHSAGCRYLKDSDMPVGLSAAEAPGDWTAKCL